MKSVIVCYTQNGTHTFARKDCNTEVPKFISNFEKSNPGAKVIHLFFTDNDQITKSNLLQDNFLNYYEKLGFKLDDYHRTCVIDRKPFKLASFQPRAKKYKVLWQNVNQPHLYLRTTTDYAHWLLNQNTINE